MDFFFLYAGFQLWVMRSFGLIPGDGRIFNGIWPVHLYIDDIRIIIIVDFIGSSI